MNKRTDLEIIPEVTKLRELLRDTKLREGKLIVKDIPSYVETLKGVIPIYRELKGRDHFKTTEKYIGFKLELVTNILKNNYGIEINTEE